LHPMSKLEIQRQSKILVKMCYATSMMMDLCCAHPQHMIFSNTVCIWGGGMWEPFQVGLEPQPLHQDFICTQKAVSCMNLTSQIQNLRGHALW
jgi:hypothetical protein